VEFCQALPRTSTGKVDRAGLRSTDIQEREETEGH
jgi:acyl-coenzyme A synthetase/AMP-(fatty) acid ligase